MLIFSCAQEVKGVFFTLEMHRLRLFARFCAQRAACFFADAARAAGAIFGGFASVFFALRFFRRGAPRRFLGIPQGGA